MQLRSAAAPIALASLAAFAGVVTGGALYYRDLLLLHRPIRMVVRAQWAQGRLPLWDPLQDGGRVLLANPNHRILHPTSLLDLLLSVDTAIAVAAIVQVFLAGWGMALFLRDRGATVEAARIGGLAFALSGPLLSLGSLPNLMGGMAWVPLILWAGLRAVDRPQRWGPLAAVLLAVPAFVGGVEAWAFCFCFLVSFILWGHPGRRLRALVTTGAVFVGASLLAAVQILPARAALGASERGVGFRHDLLMYWSMPPSRLLEAIVPRLWGVPTDPIRWWGHGVFDDGLPLILSTYSGAAALALAAAGLTAALVYRRSDAGPEPAADRPGLPGPLRISVLLGCGLTLLTLLLALGRHNPLFSSGEAGRWAHLLLRFPERVLPLGSIGVAVSAAAGWHVLAGTRRTRKASAPLLAMVLPATFLLVVLLSSVFGAFPMATLAGLDEPSSAAASWALVLPAFWALVAILIVAGCVWLAGRRNFAAAGLAALVVAVDLLVCNLPLNPTVDRAYLEQTPSAARFLVERQATGDASRPTRLLRGRDPVMTLGDDPIVSDVVWARHTLGTYVPQEFGISTALNRDVDLVTPLGNAYLRTAYRRFAKESAGARLADRAAATWKLDFVTSPEVLPAASVPFIEPVVPRAPAVALVPRPSAASRVALVPRGVSLGSLARPGGVEDLIRRMADPAIAPDAVVFLSGSKVEPVDGAWRPEDGSARVVDDAPTRMVVETEAPGPGVLVVRDSMVPGWSVEVDGEPARLVRADLAWRGVVLGAGRHRVQFAYRPEGFAPGLALSAFGLLALASCLVLSFVRSRA